MSMVYQVIAVAPDAQAAADCLASISRDGAVWGVPLPGVSGTAMIEDARYVAISCPVASRDALDQAFPGSSTGWTQRANGIDALAAWRKAVAA